MHPGKDRVPVAVYCNHRHRVMVCAVRARQRPPDTGQAHRSPVSQTDAVPHVLPRLVARFADPVGRNQAASAGAPRRTVQRRLPKVIVAHVHRAAHDRRLAALLLRLLDVGFLERTRPEAEACDQRSELPVDTRDDRSVIVLVDLRLPREVAVQVTERLDPQFAELKVFVRRSVICTHRPSPFFRS